MLDIHYKCTRCRKDKPDSYRGMVCEACGGDYRPLGQLFGQRAVFDPYYNRALGQEVTSFHDQERKIKQFNETQAGLPPELRDKQHPDGFVMTNDLKEFKDLCYISKHGKEYRREMEKKHRIGERRRDERRIASGRIYSFAR